MEQKGLLLSALGVGVGVGLGLASGQAVGKWVGVTSGKDGGLTAEKIEQELFRKVLDGRDIQVSFKEFPYYLRYTIINGLKASSSPSVYVS